MGDGYMVAFASPTNGVRCALAIQRELGTRLPRWVAPILVRIGLHTGNAVREGHDFFGREVNFAARVASSAIGGEVMVSEAVRARLLADQSFAVDAPVEVDLKGFSGTHKVFRVHA